ncbi:uncharacterized protein LOC125215083 isoform X1 [Salvia hispanica]|uniref:uncharacterized protein LOC125215083 isoform X1 n=1 Tax=Salvia hispanica TaxID=49212 RepID=UPI0020092661|nr:uncharacterized protein LOC125215083 isoform X1 [Salvia hispanica]XP_047972347.1 uncharacterized protein LOC125215083 isoform X1 [Salvia hispanica]XP_047972348.1 uncharacterized protein LOC125215083 isoform X1 [Salvia hispanica]XP_047972349.1 uncharacterized protein LOC125215083 isoform X1 [Salvia hispanica]XP_047972350.1 uncharacterized protein LOC125215083 isoform X1 [Salvia hispanica]XP_047972351.1 uncharacterized protein LOC125215083 isoform X1 [Salvia hispanica]
MEDEHDVSQHNYEDEMQFNSEDDDDDNLIIQRTDGSTRVKRGLFCSKDVWNLRNGDRIVVECNEHNQPDNRGGRVLGGWLGKVARRPNLCLLNYHTWIKMPLTFKKGVTDLAKILKSTSKKWRSYKSYLKGKYVIDGMTEQEIARQPLEEIPLQQWIHLVHYWFSNKGKIG